VDPLSELARRHPDWLLPSAVDWHWFMGQMRILRVLDITHPEAAAYIARSIRRLAAAGVELFKLDYLFLATYEDERHEPMTGIEALHRTLQIVREAAGDEAYLLACGAPPIPSLPHVDGWRVGHDIAFKPAFGIPGPGWGFVANQARQLAARWPLCEAVHCDADPALLRALPRAEVEAGAWVVAAAGGGLFLSDDLPRLSQERRAWGWDEPQRVALALSGRSAVPLDLIPARPPVELRNMRDNTLWWPGGWFYDGPEQVVPQRWRLQDGSLLGFNASDEGRRIDGVFLPARSARLLP
jgi:alpha-galactosidase